MRVFRGADVAKTVVDPNTFIGSGVMQHLAQDPVAVPVNVYRVEFADGARTNWHTHSGPQWLFVIEGRIRVQRWDGTAQDVEAGDAVVIAPDEKHWHGAAPGGGGAHIAVNVNSKTTWLEPVGDEQYGAA